MPTRGPLEPAAGAAAGTVAALDAAAAAAPPVAPAADPVELAGPVDELILDEAAEPVDEPVFEAAFGEDERWRDPADLAAPVVELLLLTAFMPLCCGDGDLEPPPDTALPEPDFINC